MPSKQPGLDEFNELIRELETPQNQPPIHLPPAPFTTNLRRRLMQTYERQPLSRQGIGRVWQLVGTAVALTLVAVAVIYFWLALASSPQDVSPSISPTIGTAPETPTTTMDSIAVVSVSPETSTIISGTTTFEVQIHYILASLPEADIIIFMLPLNGGAAILGNAVETVTQGEDDIIMRFDFQPLDTTQPSEWTMSIKMVEPDADINAKAITSTSPHKSLEDGWRYELTTP